MPSLIVREPGQVAYVVELAGALVAGRDPEATLVLADRQVSRLHLRIEAAEAGWRVVDLDSTHGIRVNGRAATTESLRDGDYIQLGGVVLIYRDVAAVTPPSSIERTLSGLVEPAERAPAADQRRLRVLFDVGRVVGALEDPDRAVARMLDMTLEVLACERGVVGLVDRNTGKSGRRIAAARNATSADDLAVPAAVLTAILERREAVFVRDPIHGVRSALGAPLDAGGRMFGFLYVDDRGRDLPFAADDLEFLTALARLAAAALAQADLVQRAVMTTDATVGTPLVGTSEPMQRLRAQITKCAAAGDATVVIHGETGTGKELVAAHVHGLSPRAGQPFVAVNCAAIPEALIESELFGFVRGAFTGADKGRRGRFVAAHRGTLFLDEIGDLSLAAQAKLLRVIEEGEVQALGTDEPTRVDVRIIAATHKDLAAEVGAGRFREDLYYRLEVLEIEVPPLRIRGDDVIVLAEHVRDDVARRLGRPRLELTPAAIAALRAYGWPGNVRQLRNEIERAVLLSEGPRIDVHDLRLRGAAPTATGTLAERFSQADRELWQVTSEALVRAHDEVAAAAALLHITPVMLERVRARDQDPVALLDETAPPQDPGASWTQIEAAERELIARALAANAKNIRATALALGVARGTLYRKIAKYKLA